MYPLCYGYTVIVDSNTMYSHYDINVWKAKCAIGSQWLIKCFLVHSAAICMACTTPPEDAFITCTLCHKTKPRHCYSRVSKQTGIDDTMRFHLMLDISDNVVYLVLMMLDAKDVSKSIKKDLHYKSRTLTTLLMKTLVMMACLEAS